MNVDIEADGAAFVVVAQSSILNRRRRTYENQNERQSWRSRHRRWWRRWPQRLVTKATKPKKRSRVQTPGFSFAGSTNSPRALRKNKTFGSRRTSHSLSIIIGGASATVTTA